MDLEKVAAVIRPRSHWEAVDLGFSMVREWARPVWSAWLVTVVPIWVATSVALKFRPGLALLVLWWLRPLFDRVPLFVLSRALFGATPTARAVLRELPRLLFGHALSALTLFRLDPARSYNLPVWQLEGLRGSARWSRAAVLRRVGHEQAMWLTGGCFQLELSITLALVVLLALLLPGDDPFDVSTAFTRLLADTGPSPGWVVTNVIALISFSLVEPFYVAAGFSLYLNRRTRLEGWDVELAFRRLARRLSAAGAASAAVLLLVCLGAPCRAATPPSDPKAVITEVLAGKEFQTKRKVTTWRLKGGPSRAPRDRTPPFQPGPLLTLLVRGAAYAIVAAGAGFLIYFTVRGVRSYRPLPRTAVAPLPSAVTGVKRLPERFPEDVPEAAARLLDEGQAVAALGLLYRAAIARLVARDGLLLRADWTEEDCLREVGRLHGSPARRDRAEAFRRLTAAWQAAAYAHRLPSPEEGRALCDLWRRQLGPRSGGEVAA